MSVKIPVVLICDEGYVMQTCVALTSLKANKKKDTFYEINVLTAGDITHKCKALKELESLDFKMKIISCDMEKYRLLQKSNDERYCVATPAALLKFDIPNVCSDYDKIIYLDGDIIVKKDLRDLYEIDITDKYVAAVPDYPQVIYETPRIDLGFGKEYFNSGVMLMNLKLMQKDNVTKALYEEKMSRVDDNLMDQNVLNIILGNKKRILPIKYNCCYLNLNRSQKKYKLNTINDICDTEYVDLLALLDDAYIVHFSSREKPWKYYDTPLSDEWLYYYMISPLGERGLKRKSIVDDNNRVEELSFETRIPVVFATNEYYAPTVAVAIQSIVENSMSSFEFFVLHTNMTNETIRKLEKMNCSKFLVHCLNVSNMISGNLFTCAHFSVEMYYRVLIPEILCHYSKVIYLDCDLLVTDDIKTLYETYLNGDIIAAVQNLLNKDMSNYVHNRLSLSSGQYINSGVLLIDTKAFIVGKIKESFFQILNLRESFACPDQDVLSIVCRNKIYLLEDKWNFQIHHKNTIQNSSSNKKLLRQYYSRYEEAERNAIIYHFSGGVKPWTDSSSYYSDLYWEYAKKTVFYEQIIQMKITNELRKKIQK